MNLLHDNDVSAVFDQLADAIVATDISGHIVYANPAAGELFGWSNEELVGRLITALLPHRFHSAFLAGFDRYITTCADKRLPHRARIPGVRRDGAELDLELSLSSIRATNGAEVVIASLRDLAPRAALELELSGVRTARDRLAFLTEAGELLDESLDYATTLERLARLVVPRLADYCLIDIVEDAGRIRRVATAHCDAEKDRVLRATLGRLVHPREDHPAAVALRTGAPVIQQGADETVWRAVVKDDELLQIARALAPHSWLFLPLTARARVIGTLGLVLSEPARTLSEQDSLLAHELARRAALAVDNARLYTAERSQRERLFSLFSKAPVAIAIMRGPELRYELSNPVNQELTGGRAVPGRCVREALPELAEQGLFNLIEQVYRTGEPYLGKEMEVTLHRPEGPTNTFVTGVLQPMQGEDGATEGVIMFACDVTEQVLARRKVEEAERLFRALTNHAPVGIFVANRAGDWELANPRLCELTGLTVEEMRGRGWIKAIHPDDRERLVRRWYDVVRSGRPFETRHRFGSPGGKPLWLQTSAVALRDPDGAITGYMGTITDVTRQHEAEEEREQLLADLEQAVRQRDDFLSIASHELRTPLATLHLHIETLERVSDLTMPERLGSRMQAKVEKMARQVAKLDDLISTLLDVSRITQGRLELHSEALDLRRLVTDVASRFSEEAEEAGCVVHVRARHPVCGHWDRLRIDQVVTNVVTNAIKYGRGKPIEIEAEAIGNRARVRIIDHGIGIPASERDRIFLRFERAVSDEHYGGLGLGLWIARQIVEAYRGTIAVDETPGGGATFTVELDR